MFITDVLVWFGLVSLFNRISIFMGNLMSNPSLMKNNWEKKGVHTFPELIHLKVSIIERVEFDLAYFKATVQQTYR